MAEKKIANSVSPAPASTHQTEEDDWSLTVDQAIFMIQQRNNIEFAEDEDDDEFFDALVASEEYKALFGKMSIDEALDRFETMLEEGRAD